jgi:hypothetical protein
MNGNKIGCLGGINIIFMVIKLPFWANAIRPYDILQVTSRCARKENPLQTLTNHNPLQEGVLFHFPL